MNKLYRALAAVLTVILVFAAFPIQAAAIGLVQRDKVIEIVEEIVAAKRREFRSDFLKKLYTLFESDMADEALGIIKNTSDFASQCGDIDESNPDLYLPEGKKGIGIYKANESRYGSYYIYYGDFENGVRNGNGFWAIANGDEYYLFEGSWENGSPNGYGDVKEWHEELNEEVTYRHKTGNLSDGLWNGTMQWDFVCPNETICNPVHFDRGKVTVFGAGEPWKGGGDPVYVAVSRNMAFTEKEINLSHGIAGFEDYGD